MKLLGALALAALWILSLRGVRWAYILSIVLGLLYFPMKAGFHPHLHTCELRLTIPLIIHSLSNFPHIIMFAFFFVLTICQFRTWSRSAFLWAALTTIVMGALVEISEGVWGRGHCRIRDLVPDTAGALIGAGVVLLGTQVRSLSVIRGIAAKYRSPQRPGGFAEIHGEKRDR